MLRLTFATVVFFICSLCFACGVCRSEQPNILFIAVDDLKPVLGCYGDEVAITPNIDRLARDGTVFLNAHCQWPVCGPSRASLMTSLRPEAVGVMNLKTSMRAKDADVITLPEHFKNHGYETAGTGKIYDPRCVDDRKTLDAPSWSLPFVMPKSPKKPKSSNEEEAEDEKRFALAPDVADSDLTDGKIAAVGSKLMRQLSKSDKPFFLAVGFKKPHLPFVAPKKYWDLYQRDQFALASHRGGIENASGYSIHDSPEFRGYGGIPKTGPISEPLQREAIHGYYACTSYVDALVGVLLSDLDSLGLRDNTVIVLWGDHGFHLGDHGMFGKHSTLEQATRVPLIICPPPFSKATGDKAIGSKATGVKPTGHKLTAKTSTPVEFTDIFPTLCEYGSIEIPTVIAGRSLKPVIEGTEAKVRDGALTVFKAKGSIGYSFRSERYRYTEWINKFDKIAATELYDYQNDPMETKNLAKDNQYTELRLNLARQMRTAAKGCDRLLSTASNNASANIQEK